MVAVVGAGEGEGARVEGKVDEGGGAGVEVEALWSEHAVAANRTASRHAIGRRWFWCTGRSYGQSPPMVH